MERYIKQQTTADIARLKPEFALLRYIAARYNVLTLYVLNVTLYVHKYIFTFYVITPHWYDTGT